MAHVRASHSSSFLVLDNIRPFFYGLGCYFVVASRESESASTPSGMLSTHRVCEVEIRGADTFEGAGADMKCPPLPDHSVPLEIAWEEKGCLSKFAWMGSAILSRRRRLAVAVFVTCWRAIIGLLT